MCVSIFNASEVMMSAPSSGTNIFKNDHVSSLAIWYAYFIEYLQQYL